MDPSDSLFRQKSPDSVPTGQQQQAVDANPSEQSGTNTRIGTPVWKSFVSNKQFQEANRQGIQAEQDQMRAAAVDNRRVQRPPMFKAANGKLLRVQGGRGEELNPEEWANDPEVGPLARKSLWEREIGGAKKEAGDASFRLKDPSFHAKGITPKRREEIVMELGGMAHQIGANYEADPGYTALKRQLIDDTEYQEEKKSLAQRSYDSEARARQLEATDPEAWWQSRGHPTAQDTQAAAVAQTQSGRAEAQAADDSAAKEEQQLRAELAQGVKGPDVAAKQARLAEIAEARGRIAQEAVKAEEPVKAVQAAAQAKQEGVGDFLRGGEVAMKQIPQLGYGVAGLIGDTLERTVGVGASLRDWGFKGYKEAEEKAAPLQRENDDVTKAWEKAKTGDVGALIDWAQYGLGYALGQAAESAAVAVGGAVIGGMASSPSGPGAVVGAGGGAVAGLVAKGAVKTAAKSLIEKAISGQAMKIAAKQLGKDATEDAIIKQAASKAVQKAAGARLGQLIAVGGNSLAMELGSIYPEAVAQAEAEGRTLTGTDIARIWGSGVAAGALEGATDMLGLDLVTGKLKGMLPDGRIAAGAIAGLAGIVTEGGTEVAQTGIERFGAGKAVTGDEATNEYINAGALGALGGGVIGGAGGAIGGGTPSVAPETDPTPEINTALAAIDPEIPPASPEEIAAARMIANPSDGAQGLAESVLIERELLEAERIEKEEYAAADEAIAQATLAGDKGALKVAEEARDNLPTHRADAVRAILKIISGADPRRLKPKELTAIGLKTGASGELETQTAEELKKNGLTERLVYPELETGFPIVTDEGLQRVAAVSPTAGQRPKMTEDQAAENARQRAADLATEQLSTDTPDAAQGDPERGSTVTGSTAGADGASPVTGISPIETKGAVEFDVPMRDGTVLRVQAPDADTALGEAASVAPITGQPATPVPPPPTDEVSQPQPQAEAPPIDQLGQTGNPAGIEGGTGADVQPASSEADPAIPAAGTAVASPGTRALIRAKARVTKAKKRLKDRLLEGQERAVTRPDGITVNPKQIIDEAVSRGMTDEQAVEYFDRILDEEIRHLAQYDAGKLLYRSENGSGPFLEWMESHYAAIWKSDFSGEKGDIIREIYARTETGIDARWDAMTDGAKALEAIRMMSQGDAVTEQGKLWANISENLKKALTAALAALKQFSDIASPALKAEITNLENALRTLTGTPDTGPATARNPQPEPGRKNPNIGDRPPAEKKRGGEPASDRRTGEARRDPSGASALVVGARVEFDGPDGVVRGKIANLARGQAKTNGEQIASVISGGVERVLVAKDGGGTQGVAAKDVRVIENSTESSKVPTQTNENAKTNATKTNAIYQPSPEGVPYSEANSGNHALVVTPSSDILAELAKLPDSAAKLAWLHQNGFLSLIGGNTHVDHDMRVMVLMRIGNANVPFYISTGMAGKKNVQSGMWYAVWGLGTSGWINKGGEAEINSQYGYPVLQKIARILNEGIGRLNPDLAPVLENYEDVNSKMNLGITPAANHMVSGVFWENVQKALTRINEETEKLAIRAGRESPVVVNETPVAETQAPLVPTGETQTEAGIEFALREDGTKKTKDEYTSEEWAAYSKSVIEAKISDEEPTAPKFFKPQTITRQNGRIVLEVMEPTTVGGKTFQSFKFNGKVIIGFDELQREYPIAADLLVETAAPNGQSEAEVAEPAKKRRTIDTPARREAFRLLNSQDTELTAINKILAGGGKIQSPPTGMLKIIRGLAGARNLTEKQMAMQRRWMDYSGFQPKSAFGTGFNGKVAQELHGMLFSQDESPGTLDDWAGRLGGVTNDRAMVEVMTELIRVSRGISKANDPRNPNRELSESEIAAETTKPATPAQNASFSEANAFDFGTNEVSVGDLKEGDTITIDGEEMTVEAVEDGGTVVLRDGTRFGRQVLASGESVWVEADDSAVDPEELETEIAWFVDKSKAQGYGDVDEHAAADPEGIRELASEAEALRQGDSLSGVDARREETPGEAQGGAGEVDETTSSNASGSPSRSDDSSNRELGEILSPTQNARTAADASPGAPNESLAKGDQEGQGGKREEEISVDQIDAAVNRRAQEALFVKKGQYHTPGLRLGDQEEAGRMAYLVEKGDATAAEWQTWLGRTRSENRFSDKTAPVIDPKGTAAPAALATAKAEVTPSKGMSVEESKVYLAERAKTTIMGRPVEDIMAMQQGTYSPRTIPTSKMDIRNADSKELFADDGGFKLGQDSTVDGAKIVAERKAKEDAKAAMDAAQGDIFNQPAKPTLTADEQALKDAFSDMVDGLEASPLVSDDFYQSKGIPRDKRALFMDVADQLYDAGVRTPADLAAKLEKVGGGKLRAYSDAVWSVLRSNYPTLPQSSDWAGIYSKINDTTSNDSTSGTPLESDRDNAGTPDGSGQGGVPTGRGATRGNGKRVVSDGTRSENNPSDRVVPADRPAASEGSERDQQSPVTASEPAERPTKPENADGSRVPDASGVEAYGRGEKDTHDGLVLPAVAGSLAQGGVENLRDVASVKKSAPALKVEQAEDVVFVEKRFEKEPGALLTNGTGTGKTFSGLGVIKRALDRGEKHVIIIAPSDKVVNDWIDTARQFFGISDIGQLDGIRDNSGKNRVVVTTYANFGQNNELVRRPWGLVVTDEAHYLSQAKDGNSTLAQKTFKGLTWHPKDGVGNRVAMEMAEELEEMSALRKSIDGNDRLMNRDDTMDQARDAYRKENIALEARWNTLNSKVQTRREELNKLAAAMKKEERPKALFLSATPFAYHFSLDYAEGYLFEHGPEPTSRKYNTPSARSKFFMENFGYRMRTGKLTQPENAAATGILERMFAERLKREGAMRGRMLAVPFDYSRDFVLAESAIGTKIDAVLKLIRDEKKYTPLRSQLEIADYLARRYLLEGLKAREAVKRINEHLALGRKVVVFHDYKKNNAVNPLRLSSSDPAAKKAYDMLRAEFPGFDALVQSLDMLQSPINMILANFPGAGLFNGDVSAKTRRANVTEFNRSGGPMNVILAQRAAGKEGISLHDIDAKHQRAFIDLGLPGRPTDAIQSEGRTIRLGMQSNGVLEYLTTGTDFERWTFAQTIATRASTAENLAMGESARALLQAFSTGYNEARSFRPSKDQGTGGKQSDAARESGDPFDNAVALYFTNQKKNSRNKAEEGVDYFATPEPLGFKMVEWAGIRPGERVLEPSGGHGAIARFFPDSTTRHAVEPSYELAGRLALNAPDTRVHQVKFEDYDIINKFDVIAMNPPFGVGGKTAMDHLEKAVKHLKEGGRVVALIPNGSSMAKRFDKWYEAVEGVYLSAEIQLPSVTFERAGTSVSARIVILDKGKYDDNAQTTYRDFTDAGTTKELFERLKESTVTPRPAPAVEKTPAQMMADLLTGGRDALIPKASKPQGIDGAFSAADFVHTQKGTTVMVARIDNKLSDSEYAAAKTLAKKYGGYYSAYNKGGAIPGFHFPDADARDAFLGEAATPTAEPLRAASPSAISAAIDSSLTAEEKAIAASELGSSAWDAPTRASFAARLADWLVSGKDASVKLAALFSKLVRNAVMAGIFAVGILNTTTRVEALSATSITNQIFEMQSGNRFSMVPEMQAETIAESADFGPLRFTENVKVFSDWVMKNRDSKGKPFIVADKSEGSIYLIDQKGKVVSRSSALFGKQIGDFKTPDQIQKKIDDFQDEDKVTTAGRFESRVSSNEEYGKYTVFDSRAENGVVLAIHRVYLDAAEEKRQQRLDTPSGEDNRISYGCINVPQSESEKVAGHLEDGGVVYVLPETPEGKGIFEGFQGLRAAELPPAEKLSTTSPEWQAMSKEERMEYLKGRKDGLRAGELPDKDAAIDTNSPGGANIGDGAQPGKVPVVTIRRPNNLKEYTHAELLPDGEILVVIPTSDWNSSIQDVITDALFELTEEPGVFWRATNNKNEQSILSNLVSKNHSSGTSEGGVSVSRTLGLFAYDYYYKLTGKVTNTGSDGEPVLTNAVATGPMLTKTKARALKEKQVSKALGKIGWTKEQYNQALFGKWKKAPDFNQSPPADSGSLRAGTIPDTLESLKQRGRADFAKARPLIENAEAQMKAFGSGSMGVDPKFANPGSTQTARDFFDINRVIDSSNREIRRDADVHRQGREYLEKNPDDVKRLLYENAYSTNAERIDDYKQYAIILLLDRQARDAFGDADMEETYTLAGANIAARREIARSMRQMRDRFQTEEERNLSQIADAIFTPSDGVIEQARKIDNPKARREFEAAAAKRRVKEVRENLKKTLGIKIEDVTGKLRDMRLVNSRLEKEVMKLRSVVEKDIIKYIRSGAGPKEIEAAFGKAGLQQAKELVPKLISEYEAKLAPLIASGLSDAEILKILTDEGLQAAALNADGTTPTLEQIKERMQRLIEKHLGLTKDWEARKPLPTIKKPKPAMTEAEMAKEEADSADKIAERWVKKLATSQSDTLSWSAKAQANINAMEALIREHVKNGVRDFRQKAENLGASPEQSFILDKEAIEERRRVALIKAERESRTKSQEAIAEKIIAKYATSQSDTLAWGKAGKPTPAILELFRKHIKELNPNFIKEAEALGVSTRKAEILNSEANEERKRVALVKYTDESEAKTPEAIAKSILDRITKNRENPPAKAKIDPIRDLVRRHTRKKVVGFRRQMTELGVSGDVLDKLESEITTERLRNQEMRKNRQPKPVKTSPVEADWSRPEFTDGLKSVTFDTTDRENIMTAVEAIRSLAQAVGSIERLSGDQRVKADAALAKVNAILAKYGTDAEQIFESGLPIASYRFDPSDQAQVSAVLRVINAMDADWIDKGMEYGYGSMLSGTQTAMVNAGAGVHAVHSATVGRGVELVMNSFMNDPMAAQWGEVKYVLRALAPGLSRAWSNMIATWKAQHPMVERDLLAMEVDWDAHLGGALNQTRNGVISGKKGDIIRMPMRALSAVDDFNKTLFGMAEGAAFAYRLAMVDSKNPKSKNFGMKPGDAKFERFIRIEMNTPGSLSLKLGVEKAAMLIFNNALPGQKDYTGQIKKVRDLGDLAGQGAAALNRFVTSTEQTTMTAKFFKALLRMSFFPFQRTPFNIIRGAARYTPNPVSLFIDIPLLAFDNMQAVNEATGKREWGWNAKNRGAEFIERMGMQLQGAAAMMILMAIGAGEGDEDDDEKFFLMTGSQPYSPSRRAEIEARRRAGVEAYRVSFRRKDGSEIAGFSYGRIEPYATAFSSVIDTLAAYKRGKRAGEDVSGIAANTLGSLVDQAKDKTFMRGLGDLVGMVENMRTSEEYKEPNDRKVKQFIAGRVAMIIPNIIRQPIREADANFREKTDSYMTELLYTLVPAGQKPAKVDPYGNEETKRGIGAGRMFDPLDIGTKNDANPIDKMLIKWRDSGAWSKAADPSDRKPWFPSPINNAEFKHRVTGQNVKMNAAQLAEFRQKSGQLLTMTLKSQGLNYDNPSQLDIDKVRKSVTKAREVAKKALAFKFSI